MKQQQIAEQILNSLAKRNGFDSWNDLLNDYDIGDTSGETLDALIIAAIVEALSLPLQLPTDDQIEENGKEGGLKDGELQMYWEGAVWLRDVWIPKHTKVEALSLQGNAPKEGIEHLAQIDIPNFIKSAFQILVGTGEDALKTYMKAHNIKISLGSPSMKVDKYAACDKCEGEGLERMNDGGQYDCPNCDGSGKVEAIGVQPATDSDLIEVANKFSQEYLKEGVQPDGRSSNSNQQ
jgi:hypothetical protein